LSGLIIEIDPNVSACSGRINPLHISSSQNIATICTGTNTAINFQLSRKDTLKKLLGGIVNFLSELNGAGKVVPAKKYKSPLKFDSC